MNKEKDIETKITLDSAKAQIKKYKDFDKAVWLLSFLHDRGKLKKEHLEMEEFKPLRSHPNFKLLLKMVKE